MQKYGNAFSKSSSIDNLPNYSEQFKKIIKRYKKVGHNVNINAWFKTQTRFKGLVFSVIARRWVRPPTQWRLCGKALICGLVPDAYL